jgi:hypothetical protein
MTGETNENAQHNEQFYDDGDVAERRLKRGLDSLKFEKVAGSSKRLATGGAV